MTDGEKAMTILQATHDGDDLAPTDLQLVELAVNGQLAENRQEQFASLYEACARDEYSQPWFHGIKHMTIDLSGWIYWKGTPVECYHLEYAYSVEASEDAQEIAERCRHLQSIGEVPNMSKVIWHWDTYANKQPVRAGGKQ